MSQPLPPPAHEPRAASTTPKRHSWRRGAAIAGVAVGVGVGYVLAQGSANAATTVPTVDSAAATSQQSPVAPANPVQPNDPTLPSDPNGSSSSGGGWTAPQPLPAQGGGNQGGWQSGGGPGSSGS